jgi:two-component system, NtrC family, sensor kinase
MRANVLLVDDEPANLVALEAILEPLGQNLVKARSGAEALRRLLEDDFAVLLLDVQMRGLDGFETARLVRGRDRSRHTPIIFLTAHDSRDFPVARAYALGAVDYLVKPLVPEILRAKVAGFVDLFQKTEEVQRQAERFRRLTEACLEAIVAADQEGNMTLFNPAAERVFGYRAAEVLGQPLSLLMPAEDRAAYQRGLLRYVRTRQAHFIGRTVQLRGRRKDGAEFPLEVALSAIDLGEELEFLGCLRDLTEQNRMRALLVRSEKLASIGLLSAGIAHEINNPLAFIATNLAVLDRDSRGLMALLEAYEGARDRLAEVDPEAAQRIAALAEENDLPYVRDNLDRLLERTRAGVERVTRIVQSLRGLARTDPPELEEACVPDLMDMALEMVRGRLQRRAVKVTLDYGGVPKVRCAPTQIGQVLLNLLVNAVQAIDAAGRAEGGCIRITSRGVGKELLIEVADNGCGIDPRDLPRLFDPFFTTKPVGEGTGLGLSISHGIITAHGGRIEVDSRPGEGSQFRIFLPLDPGLGSP